MPSLKSFLFLPVLLFALIIWGVSFLVEKYDFLIPYTALFLIIAVIENTQMFCFIITILGYADQRDKKNRVLGTDP